MKRLLPMFVAIALCPLPGWAQDGRDALIQRIEQASIADLGDGKRQDAEVQDCLYLLRTWGPGVHMAERLWGIAAVDLTTVTLGDPLFFAAYVAGLSEHGDYEQVFREGSAVMHLSRDDAPPGQFGLAAAPGHPIQREEWLGRPRTQSFADEGQTQPSPREDGASYVFRTSDKLAITYLFPGGAAQLRELEAAMTAYKSKYCASEG